MQVSIIVPTLNEEQTIDSTLRRLQPLRMLGHELIVVDGGSSDSTVQIAHPLSDRVLQCEKGRAKQMNCGANVAHGEVYLFLHADTQISLEAFQSMLEEMRVTQRVWGRFNVKLSGQKKIFRVIERMMNWRSCFTSVATGDQAIFVEAAAFKEVTGFDVIPLMEDIAISKKLRKLSRPLCVRATVTTSSRRWETFGVWRTILLMWRLRLYYFFGASPATLATIYRSDVH